MKRFALALTSIALATLTVMPAKALTPAEQKGYNYAAELEANLNEYNDTIRNDDPIDVINDGVAVCTQLMLGKTEAEVDAATQQYLVDHDADTTRNLRYHALVYVSAVRNLCPAYRGKY